MVINDVITMTTERGGGRPVPAVLHHTLLTVKPGLDLDVRLRPAIKPAAVHQTSLLTSLIERRKATNAAALCVQCLRRLSIVVRYETVVLYVLIRETRQSIAKAIVSVLGQTIY